MANCRSGISVPPIARYRPRRPSCGSPYGWLLTSVRLRSTTSRIDAITSSDAAMRSVWTNDRSSAEVWYSGNWPWRPRMIAPTGIRNPGELNCRSS